MKKYRARLRQLTMLTALLTSFLGQAQAAELAPEIQRLHSQMVPMRDGIELSADIYLPTSNTQALPTLLIRTVYNKRNTFDWNPVWAKLVNKGYAIVIQDIRGRYESGGAYRVAQGRREDGIDTLNWIAKQPWSNGRIGTAGCSYLGETQIVLATTQHPNLVTAIPMSSASGYYLPGRAWQAFSGGAFELGQTAGWFASSGAKHYPQPPEGIARDKFFQSEAGQQFELEPKVNFDAYLKALQTLPVIDVMSRAGLPENDFTLWRREHPDGDYFQQLDLATDRDHFSIPALFMDSWYDYGPDISLHMQQQFQRNGTNDANRNQQFLVIGPGNHCNYQGDNAHALVGERDLGDTRFDYEKLQIDWYDYWLKGLPTGVLSRPKITYFLMGKNQWQHTEHWPPANAYKQRWYLSSQRGANSLAGDGRLSLTAPKHPSSDSFSYDPGNPVPSLGGHTCCTGSDTEAGGYDQRRIEQRPDVLVYSSDTLTEGVELTGAITAHLWVSSNVKDTDFTVKLVDVYPDGRAFNIQEGVLRMRYRNSLREPEMMQIGKKYPIEIDLHASANYFPAGHRIRVEISSSNYPRYERNLNTGGNNYDETRYQTAVNQLYFGPQHASYIEFDRLPELQKNQELTVHD